MCGVNDNISIVFVVAIGLDCIVRRRVHLYIIIIIIMLVGPSVLENDPQK